MNTKLLNDKLYSLTFYFRPLHSRCQLANSKQFVISNLFKTVFISVSGRIQARAKPFTNVKRKNNLSNKRELEKIGYLTNIVETTVLVVFFLQFRELTWTELLIAGLIHCKCTNAVSSKSFPGRVITSPRPCLHTTSTRFGTTTPCTPKRKSAVSI